MKQLPILLVLLGSAAGPALADQQSCEADLRALAASPAGALAGATSGVGAAGAALPQPAFENGRCVIRDVVLPLDSSGTMRQAVRADAVAWTAQWPDAARTFPPTQLALDASGLRLDYEYDGIDPAVAYGMRLLGETAMNRAALDYSYDPATGSLALRRLSLGNRRDRVDISARVEQLEPRVFLSPDGAFDAVLRVRLEQIDLRLTNSVFFESMGSLWLPLIHPKFGATPDEAVDGAKREAQRQIASVPDAVASPSARAAFAAAVESLPHPAGELHLTITAPNGLALGDVAPALAAGGPTWAELAPRLDGTRIDAQWLPRAAE